MIPQTQSKLHTFYNFYQDMQVSYTLLQVYITLVTVLALQ